MASQNRMMTLVAFLQAQNCSNLPGSWRHPATMLDFLTPEYYQRIARTLEDGKIQMAFFDDRLALPDIYTGHHAAAVAAGVRAVKMDPSTILMTMGMVTQRLGLGVTYSTTYYEPFHVARLFPTMDLMLKGRAAWNIVTSLNRAEAANLSIEWREVGGPAVAGSPNCKYGVSVIRDLIPQEFGGLVDLAFSSGGVCCRIEIPSRS